MNKSLFIFLLVAATHGATYYIDYSTGNDTNNGTSKLTPWKHCPGMAPFTNSVPNPDYSHVDGDQFIFKGGVKWPTNALPIRITLGGNAANHDLYGATDPTWFTGSSWSHAILDCDETVMTNRPGNVSNRENVIFINGAASAGITISGFIIQDFVVLTNALSFGNALYAIGTSAVLVSNCISSNYVIQTYEDGTYGSFLCKDSPSDMILTRCKTYGPNEASIARRYRTYGPWQTYGPYAPRPFPKEIDPIYGASGPTAGAGPSGWSLCEYYEGLMTTQGLFNCGKIARYNKAYNGGNSFHGAAHPNAIWTQGHHEVYGNLIMNIPVIAAFILPGYAGDTNVSLRFHDNIIINSGDVTISPQGQPDISNEIWVYNNTFYKCDIVMGTTKTGQPFAICNYRNNLEVDCRIMPINISPDMGLNYTNQNNLAMTYAAANALGMFTNNWMKPATAHADLNIGYNFSAKSTTDAEKVARPSTGPWLVGAYQIDASAVAIPPIPTGLTAVPSLSRVTVSWSSTAGADSYVLSRAVEAGSYSNLSTNTTTSYDDLDVINGTLYHYKIAARNSAGDSAFSADVTATPVATLLPDSPTGFTATFTGGTTVHLIWNSAAGAATYNLKRYDDLSGQYLDVTTTAGTSYDDTTGLYGHLAYELRSRNAGGDSEAVVATVFTPVQTSPTLLGLGRRR